MGIALLVIGGIIAFVGGVMLLICAFKESILWGLGSLFIPIVGLVFIFTHWDDTKKPFFIYIIGIVILIVGVAIGGSTAQPVVKF